MGVISLPMTTRCPAAEQRRLLDDPEGIKEAWAGFKNGGVVTCPTTGAQLSLSVDGATGAYRLVCSGCGFPSPWFNAGPGGVTFRESDPRSSRF